MALDHHSRAESLFNGGQDSILAKHPPAGELGRPAHGRGHLRADPAHLDVPDAAVGSIGAAQLTVVTLRTFIHDIF
jgi:hypothetical protein